MPAALLSTGIPGFNVKVGSALAWATGGSDKTRLAGPKDPPYFRGSTASLSCFAILAFTTVFAGILMASPVAGLRPIRALRF